MEHDPERPLDPRDYSRRTLLANERTYLAWWRTGLTTLTVALAAARVVPELSNARHHWPYVAIGIGFAVLGIVCLAYGERRRSSVERALEQGEFSEPDRRLLLGLTGGAIVLGVAMIILMALD